MLKLLIGKVLDFNYNGREIDLVELSKEDWVRKQASGKIVDFAIGMGGDLYLIDSAGRTIHANRGRFRVDFLTYEDVKNELQKNELALNTDLVAEDYKSAIFRVERMKENLEHIQEFIEVDGMPSAVMAVVRNGDTQK